MRMNALEKLLMNNALRAFSQWWIEAPLLLMKGGKIDGGEALELGCGRGEGARVILERFGAARVVGVDLDPDQIQRGRRRVEGAGLRGRVELRVGDAARLDLTDARFEGVFVFGALHYVPEWRRALAEVARVLRPGGRFYYVEALRSLLRAPLLRSIFHAPEEGLFTAEEFAQACEAAGLKLLGPPQWVLGFIVGAAERPRG